ncbi:MAG: RNA polymerase sigma-70 factor [Bacteroidota bacterium]
MINRNLEYGNQYFIFFREGEEKGFDFFFRQYYAALCFYANRYVKDAEASKDIVSDGFIQLWTNREKIETESHLKNYLYKTVYHGCLRRLENEERKTRHEKSFAAISETEEKDLTENIIRAETLRQLKDAMNQLPAQCKKIFFKLYIEGKSVKETAEELKLTTSTIKNQKARGIKLLRIKLTSLLLLFIYFLP